MSDETIRRLKIHTCIAVTPGKWKYHAFVWTEEPDGRVLIPYLDALTKKHTVYIVKYDGQEKEFFCSETPYVKGATKKLYFKPLQDVLRTVTRTSPDFTRLTPPTDEVRNSVRHNQAIWGFMSVLYRRNIFDVAVLPRIFMNFGPNLYFERAWDIDRVYMVKDQVVVLEVKHKDPFPHTNAPRALGINKGSLGVLERLGNSGARCSHLVLVKPVWDKEISSMYLLGNIEAREKALLVGCEITMDEICAY